LDNKRINHMAKYKSILKEIDQSVNVKV